MKSGDKFQLSSAWWKKNKDLTAPEGGLGKVLLAYESVAKKFEQGPSQDLFDQCLLALTEVENKAKEVGARCTGPFNKTTAAALKKNEALHNKRSELTKGKDTYLGRLRDFKQLAARTAKLMTEQVEVFGGPQEIIARLVKYPNEATPNELQELEDALDGVLGKIEDCLEELDKQGKALGEGLHPLDASAAGSQMAATIKLGKQTIGALKKTQADLAKIEPPEEEGNTARKFLLSPRWWRDNRGSAPDGGLEAALKDYETWSKAVQKEESTQTYPQLLHALDEVSRTVAAVQGQCDPVTQKGIVAALKGAKDVIGPVKTRFEKAHKTYLKKVLAYNKETEEYLKFQMLNRKGEAFSGKLAVLNKKTVEVRQNKQVKNSTIFAAIERLVQPVVKERLQLDTLRNEAATKMAQLSVDGIAQGDQVVGRKSLSEARGLNNGLESMLRKAKKDLENELMYTLGTPETARGGGGSSEKPINTGAKPTPAFQVQMTPPQLRLQSGRTLKIKGKLLRRDDYEEDVIARLDLGSRYARLTSPLPALKGKQTDFELTFQVGDLSEASKGVENMMFTFKGKGHEYQATIPCIVG